MGRRSVELDRRHRGAAVTSSVVATGLGIALAFCHLGAVSKQLPKIVRIDDPASPTPDDAAIGAILDRSTTIRTETFSGPTSSQFDWLNKSAAEMPAEARASVAGDTLGQNLKNSSNQAFTSAAEAYSQQSAPSSQATAFGALHVAATGDMGDPNNRQSVEQYADHTLMSQQEQAASSLVFISASVPDGVLREMFATVANDPTLENSVVFVLRGWANEPAGMAILARHMQSLMPDHGREQANVEVNPSLFTEYKISAVPTLEHKVLHPGTSSSQPASKWVQVLGVADIGGAIAALDHGKSVENGPTWPISETDIVAAITARMKSYNWQHAVDQTRNSGWTGMVGHLALSLPTTQTALSYSVDPSIVVTQDIVLPNGKVLAHAGDRVNPLTQFPFPWPQVYGVFDATSPWQVAQAQAWKSEYGSRLVLMSNRLPADFTTWVHMSESFGSQVYAFPQSLADRLGVRAVPSIVVPNGSVFDVKVIAVPPQAALAEAAGYRQ